MFLDKTGAYLCGASLGFRLALTPNSRLGWRGMSARDKFLSLLGLFGNYNCKKGL